MKPIYLDYHATTPCAQEVVDVMLPYFREKFGNAASRGHRFGFEAKAAVDHARDQIAAAIGGSASEIVFTSGATEALNLAIFGLASDLTGHGMVSAIEHKAVLESAQQLAQRGFHIDVIPVDAHGRVDPQAIAKAIRSDTKFIAVQLANNEIGTIQSIVEIADIAQSRKIPLVVDAVQAIGRIPIDVRRLGIDLMALSAHKIYGPKGIGALWIRKGRPKISLLPQTFGGGHERGLRAGTLPVPLIVGFGAAIELVSHELTTEPKRQHQLRRRLWDGLQLLGAQLNGPNLTTELRLPNNLNIYFPGLPAEHILLALRDIAMSTGAACSSADPAPSHVLLATIGAESAFQSIRFGLGRDTTEIEIDEVVRRFHEEIPKLYARNSIVDS